MSDYFIKGQKQTFFSYVTHTMALLYNNPHENIQPNHFNDKKKPQEKRLRLVKLSNCWNVIIFLYFKSEI